MTRDFLNDVAVLCIQSDVAKNIDLIDVIESFVLKKNDLVKINI